MALPGPLYSTPNGVMNDLYNIVETVGRDSEKAQQWAVAHRADNALYARFQAFQPMGECSMDTTPQDAARLYAELAWARGDRGRFLQLQVRIMGDQFRRVAQSSYGEAAHGSQASRLASTGVDVDTFFLGLLIEHADRDPVISTWRLARSIREAGRLTSLQPQVVRLATSAQSDAYNRLRATQVLAYWAEPTEREPTPESLEDRDHALDVLSAMELHSVARAWLEHWRIPTR
jgi:hypothetical protein